MPRAPRIEYAGAVYHVMSRGQRQEEIVYDVKDRLTLLDTLSEVCDRTGWRLHAWVLMPNHFHWLLETPEPNLVAGMQWFQTTYSTRFRLRHGLAGHVFQGRYKAVVVEPDSDTYFLALSSYIHLNPVRSKGLLPPDEPLENYRWSSYPYYRNSRNRRPSYLVVDRVLGNLGLRDDRTGRQRYACHMEARCQEVRDDNLREKYEEEWMPLRQGWCLGSQAFRNQMLDRVPGVLNGHIDGSIRGDAIREHDERAARNLVNKAMGIFKLAPENLPGLKKSDPRKQVIAWWVRTNSTMSNRWVAKTLHMGHEMNASASVRMVREAKGNERARLRKLLEETLRF